MVHKPTVMATILALLSALAGSCAKNQPPEILPIDAQVAYVGSRFELRIVATDQEGDPVTYSYDAPGLELSDRARLARVGSEAIFSFTPIAADIGEHGFDFRASDGSGEDIETVTIVVRSSSGPDTAPVFRKPLGEGTALDLGQAACLSLEVVVEDSDTIDVDIRQDPPIQGSTLSMTGLTGIFKWCPTQAQADQQRFALRLAADDHDNPPVRKDYTILVLSDLPQSCPGQPPVIQHTPPADQTTAEDLLISATVTDEKGLKGTPMVYHTTSAPADPTRLDYGKLTQLGLTASPPGGTLFSGRLPNPTAGLAGGASRTIYYVIVAEDDDDPAGNCDHRTQAPPADIFKVVVTRPATAACTGNVQCKVGEVCSATGCVPDTCTPVDSNGDKLFFEQASCPAKHFCPAKGPVAAPSHCAESCLLDADCKLPGYKCKVFDTKPGCALEGSKNIGTGCASFNECKGKAMCLPWAGGYCSISDCDTTGAFSGPCPSGSFCVPMPDTRFKSGVAFLCLKTCTTAFGTCRTSQGYDCKDVVDDTDTPRKVCLP